MPTFLKPRTLVVAGALLAIAVLAALLIFRKSDVHPSPTVVEKAKPSIPLRKAGENQLTAAEWMDKVHRTPAAGRAALMRQILALDDERLRNEIAIALATEWLASDLDGYLVFLDALRVEEGLSSESMKRFSSALLRSFESVSGKAELTGKIRYVAEVIVDYLTANELDLAESWAREFQVGLDQDTALAKIAPAMVATSPARALEIFASIKSTASRLSAVTELGTALANQNPDAALKWANSIGSHSERTLAMDSVAATLSSTDPELAASSLKAFLERIQDDYLERREKDRQQAGVKPEDEFQTPEIYQEYLETNGYVLMQPDTPEADYLLKACEQIGRQLAKNDPLGAIAWAESLAVGIAQAHAISGALSRWSVTAPRKAVDYYLANYGDDSAMPLPLFENWAEKDPEAAVAAIQDLPNSAQKSSAIRGVTNGWLESEDNIGGLIQWVGRLPAGADKDAANLEIIAQTGDANPSGAWKLVMEISDPASRRRAANEVFSLLAINDPKPARSVLHQYQAPAEEIEALRRILSVAESSN